MNELLKIPQRKIYFYTNTTRLIREKSPLKTQLESYSRRECWTLKSVKFIKPIQACIYGKLEQFERWEMPRAVRIKVA